MAALKKKNGKILGFSLKSRFYMGYPSQLVRFFRILTGSLTHWIRGSFRNGETSGLRANSVDRPDQAGSSNTEED
ncbi:hypothetical protein CCACVL1_22938 [Corchorus capsularis]|uniref:Uncharacterized protein n=1 Tax=Corchorus capsularis TaxID=210143 RepID=A0A1R3GW47_COCAP|nr:hypothetical protein CCACVL1_22938 [Corchorus capsularis]